MGKVSSFRAEQVKLTCDEPTVHNLSERWGIDPWRVRLLVKEFDFERGVVIVDGITKELEFYVDEKEYK